MSETTTAVELRGVTKRFGDVVAVDDIDLTVADGEFFSLLGPSGCGKTTTLRMIAGLELPTQGSLSIHGEEMGLRPPNKRPVNTVFQSYALFPHMDVRANIGFGLEMRRVDKDERSDLIDWAISLVEMGGMERRKPNQLSGGQQQRVALARALVNRPEVLLLDEPLGALDLKLRQQMQIELKNLQREVGITFIYVTHDQEEALAISDRVIVMNVGVIEQIGTPEEIYNKPRSRFVADFVGSANLIKGRPAGDGTFVAQGGTVLKVMAPHKPHGKETEVAVRTAYIGLEPLAGENHVPGKVRQRLFHGDFVQYVVDSPVGAMIVRRPPTNLLPEGADVTLSFSPEHCVLLEA